MELVLPVDVVLGQGTMTVGECLALVPQSVVRLMWSAGEPLHIAVICVPLARGVVVIVHDRAGIRVTDILPVPGRSVDMGHAVTARRKPPVAQA